MASKLINHTLVEHYLEIDSKKNVSVESLNIYNVFRFSQKRFLEYLFTTYSSLLSTSIPNKPLGATMAILLIIWTFQKGALKKFNDRDSKVLYALYSSNGKGYIEDILNSFISNFEEDISIEEIVQSLQTLADYKIIKQSTEGEIQIIDNIELIRV